MDFTNGNILREIPISVWYPAASPVGSGTRMRVLDYMQILKEEEEWEHLPNDFILDWFYYPNTEENQEHLKEEVNAQLNVNPIEAYFSDNPVCTQLSGFLNREFCTLRIFGKSWVHCHVQPKQGGREQVF